MHVSQADGGKQCSILLLNTHIFKPSVLSVSWLFCSFMSGLCLLVTTQLLLLWLRLPFLHPTSCHDSVHSTCAILSTFYITFSSTLSDRSIFLLPNTSVLVLSMFVAIQYRFPSLFNICSVVFSQSKSFQTASQYLKLLGGLRVFSQSKSFQTASQYLKLLGGLRVFSQSKSFQPASQYLKLLGGLRVFSQSKSFQTASQYLKLLGGLRVFSQSKSFQTASQYLKLLGA